MKKANDWPRERSPRPWGNASHAVWLARRNWCAPSRACHIATRQCFSTVHPKASLAQVLCPFLGGKKARFCGQETGCNGLGSNHWKLKTLMRWLRILFRRQMEWDGANGCSCYWHFFFLQLPQCCSLPSHSSSSTSSNNSSSETNRQLRWALVALLGSSWNCRTIIQHVTVCHSRPTTGKQFVQTPLEKQKYFGQRTAERTWKDHVAQRHHTSSGQEDLTCPRSRLIGGSCTRYVSEIFRDV